MKLTEPYRALSQAFTYPWDKDELLLALARIDTHIEQTGKGVPLAGLTEFIARTDLAGIQEEYVTTFDLSPACAPYVGHHLYGDTHKKGEYMICIKGIYREHGYIPPGDELPDHLSVIFEFMGHLAWKGADAARREIISAHVLAGLDKMREAVKSKSDMHWKDLITAACALCAADCEEVTSC
jgi:nitrate reductase molybdenum cofactor assembly chaperone NarJ/NarW